MRSFRITTRKSPLALCQARLVARRLRKLYPDLRVRLLPRESAGDRMLQHPLAGQGGAGQGPGQGGKSLFTGELEDCLLRGAADAAVHSMKDLSAREPEGLCLGAILERAAPGDALVSSTGLPLQQLSPGARVGTSSLRRRCQIGALRPELRVLPLRGNLQTRLDKLSRGELEAVVLAVAGLQRLGLAHRISEYLPEQLFLPAIGQGALGVQLRADDKRSQALVAPLNHRPTWNCVQAERAVSRVLEADCQAPVAAWAVPGAGDSLRLQALVGSPDGQRIIKAGGRGVAQRPGELGQRVAELLLGAGAGPILAQL